jgi:hypothetical protein
MLVGLEPARADPEPAFEKELRTVLFGSLDGGRSAFLNTGFKHRFAGPIDHSGIVLMGVAGLGGSPERDRLSGSTRFSFQPTVQTSALVGYQWIREKVTLAAFLGPELDYERYDDPRRSSLTRVGLRGQAELWAHPTTASLFTTTVIAGSARGHIWARVSAGHTLKWEGVFIGPEALLYRTEDYREWRLGVHATGLRLGGVSLRLSGGYGRASDDRHGAYVGLTAHARM